MDAEPSVDSGAEGVGQSVRTGADDGRRESAEVITGVLLGGGEDLDVISPLPVILPSSLQSLGAL